ncbi:hypothetical protein ACH5Y9_19780 [Methylomonas sp. BW4-1]|uniref:Uncharacterized protein n=1 Tax=Methylomonas defluvii TaxID=3045149 RepID=A0ABU4UD64_9GAMM|nr:MULTISPECIES: hypothetical protein [unclassified Methylomonas]MDX8127121.1 hypothetical protein [Methylomonas sp. OY6]NOV31585.1 hypothetical protein [Methylomonas sp. ZR1]PKD39362.1 hypothetical protein CWO84_16765 [Methylomonas sp. Kb3]QBC25666.1 hypothetical protein U737_01375 [Methylomonas sp. LW13]QSB01087.1 hypothetical protein JWZ98_21005 [Methylomonas sp. EFPC1]
MNKKKIIIFAVCLAGLLAIQIKFFLPFMYDIAASDLFLVESKDAANPMSISTDMTAMAFAHCNTYIKNEADEDQSLSFASQPTNAWTLGNYEYIVNADVEISGKDSPNVMRHYACRIQYGKGDDTSGASDFENWSVEGVSGLTD